MLWWHLRGLRSSNAKRRLTTAGWLGGSRNPAAVPALIGALSDGDHQVQAAAAQGLRQLLDDPQSSTVSETVLVGMGAEAIQALIGRLAEPVMAPSVIAALVRIGPASIEPLTALVHSGDQIARHSALNALARLGWDPTDAPVRAELAICRGDWKAAGALGKDALGPLSATFLDGDADARQTARLALESMDHITVALVERLESPEARERAAAVAALTVLGVQWVFRQFKDLLKDPTLLVRVTTAISLRALHWRPANPEDGKEIERILQATGALREAGALAQDLLESMLEGPDEAARARAAEVLKSTNGAWAREALVRHRLASCTPKEMARLWADSAAEAEFLALPDTPQEIRAILRAAPKWESLVQFAPKEGYSWPVLQRRLSGPEGEDHVQKLLAALGRERILVRPGHRVERQIYLHAEGRLSVSVNLDTGSGGESRLHASLNEAPTWEEKLQVQDWLADALIRKELGRRRQHVRESFLPHRAAGRR